MNYSSAGGTERLLTMESHSFHFDLLHLHLLLLKFLLLTPQSSFLQTRTEIGVNLDDLFEEQTDLLRRAKQKNLQWDSHLYPRELLTGSRDMFQLHRP